MRRRWPWWLVAAGGAIMCSLWPLFISLHGPTSFNLNRRFLGQDPPFWGAMMNGPASLLIAAGLLLLLPTIWVALGMAGRFGYLLVVTSLVLTGVMEVVSLSIGPPVLYPVEAAGLALLTVSGRPLHTVTRIVLGVMAALLAATLLGVFVSVEQYDAIEGCRVHRLLAHVAVGIGWIVAGITEGLRHRGERDHLRVGPGAAD